MRPKLIAKEHAQFSEMGDRDCKRNTKKGEKKKEEEELMEGQKKEKRRDGGECGGREKRWVKYLAS